MPDTRPGAPGAPAPPAPPVPIAPAPHETVAQAIRAAAARLARAGDGDPALARLDAELLMAHALGVARGAMLLHHARDAAPPAYAALIARRAAHEPVAYITGEAEFYGLALTVTPAVLIPRADSETLIEAARALLADRPPGRILDLGTGSGCLLLAALGLWPDAAGIGIERSAGARAVAAANARRHAPAARILAGDWTQPGWADGLPRQDLILANPPYVETAADLAPAVRAYEPAGALFAGADGLADYRMLIPQLPALLAPGGLAVIEIGHTQAAAVTAIAAAAGLTAGLHRDLAGRPRALTLTAKPAMAVDYRPGG